MIDTRLREVIIKQYSKYVISENAEEIVLLFDNKLGVRFTNKQFITRGNRVDVIEKDPSGWVLLTTFDDGLRLVDVLDWINAVKITEYPLG